ncbi:MAG: hypothetical protein AB1440_26505 [Pseudomonadota bacterium]|jgi:hypothetical protein
MSDRDRAELKDELEELKAMVNAMRPAPRPRHRRRPQWFGTHLTVKHWMFMFSDKETFFVEAALFLAIPVSIGVAVVSAALLSL